MNVIMTRYVSEPLSGRWLWLTPVTPWPCPHHSRLWQAWRRGDYRVTAGSWKWGDSMFMRMGWQYIYENGMTVYAWKNVDIIFMKMKWTHIYESRMTACSWKLDDHIFMKICDNEVTVYLCKWAKAYSWKWDDSIFMKMSDSICIKLWWQHMHENMLISYL